MLSLQSAKIVPMPSQVPKAQSESEKQKQKTFQSVEKQPQKPKEFTMKKNPTEFHTRVAETSKCSTFLLHKAII